MTFKLSPEGITVNQHAKHLGQRSFLSKHTHPTDCSAIREPVICALSYSGGEHICAAFGHQSASCQQPECLYVFYCFSQSVHGQVTKRNGQRQGEMREETETESRAPLMETVTSSLGSESCKYQSNLHNSQRPWIHSLQLSEESSTMSRRDTCQIPTETEQSDHHQSTDKCTNNNLINEQSGYKKNKSYRYEPRSTQPSTFRGMVKWVPAKGRDVLRLRVKAGMV